MTLQISRINKDTDFLAILASIIFLLIATFIPSVKLFFVLAFVYFSFLSIKFSFGKAVIYSGIMLSYFSVGQSHSVLVIPEKALSVHQYIGGRFLGWGISPSLVINIVAFLLFSLWQQRFKNKLNLLQHEKMIMIIFGWGILTALYGSLMPTLSIYYTLTSLLSMVWLIYLIILGQNSNKTDWQKILFTILCIIILIIFYESLIVFLQMLYHGPVGLLIEAVQMAPTFGLGADELSSEFRPFGLKFHPNGLANHQFLLSSTILIMWSYLQALKKQNQVWQKIIMFATIASLITIILSLSRAIFLAIFVVLLIIYLKHPTLLTNWQKNMTSNLKKVKLKHKIILVILGLTLTFKFANRSLNTIYSFTEFGGVNTRLIQYEEAWQVFRQSPILGIGDGMFIPTSYQIFPKGVMTYFPENVHNGFLLFMTERGLLGIIFYAIFLFFFYKKIQQVKLKKISQTMLYSAIAGGFIIMTLHPERNFFSLPILLSIAIIHYENYQKRIIKKN